MNFKLTATKKTYYIVGGCAAALALAGAALYLPAITSTFCSRSLPFWPGPCSCWWRRPRAQKRPRAGGPGGASFAAGILFPRVPPKVGGALAWPVFAAAHFMAAEKEGDNLRTLSFLVMLAGGVQLVFSFVPLGAMFKGVLAW